MKKRFLPILLACILCLWIVCPLAAQAATPLDPNADASLTLHYQKDGVSFPELEIQIYRVAQATADGSFYLTAPFASYPVDIHGITTQEQWHRVAQTLYSYIVADQVAPDRQMKTDESGTVCFSDLKTGLYFVREVAANNETGTYVFNQFMVYVPTPQPDGTYAYGVEAFPKCTEFVPKTHYSVTKLWQDAGNQAIRPDNVTVEIYKDGVLYETQILSPANDWTYTWYISGEDPAIWTVAERSSPDIYKVTVQQNSNHFSIVNTYQAPSDIPQTGDSFSPILWILLLCLSGAALLILGIYSRRRQ